MIVTIFSLRLMFHLSSNEFFSELPIGYRNFRNSPIANQHVRKICRTILVACITHESKKSLDTCI